VVRQGRRERDPPPDAPAGRGGPPPAAGPAAAGRPAPDPRPARGLGLTTGRWTVPGRVGLRSSPAGGTPTLPLRTRLLQVGGVFAVILTVVLGGVVSSAIVTRASAGPPIRVATDVRIQPLSGWRQARSEPGGILLTRGSANLAVTASEGVSDPAELAEQYLARQIRAGAVGPLVVSGIEAVHVRSGLPGERFKYEGDFGEGGRTARVRGEVTAVAVPDGTGAVFDAWSSPPEVFSYQEGDVHRMIQTAELR